MRILTIRIILLVDVTTTVIKAGLSKNNTSTNQVEIFGYPNMTTSGNHSMKHMRKKGLVN